MQGVKAQPVSASRPLGIEREQRAGIALGERVGCLDQRRVIATGGTGQADTEQAVDDQVPARAAGGILAVVVPPCALKRRYAAAASGGSLSALPGNTTLTSKQFARRRSAMTNASPPLLLVLRGSALYRIANCWAHSAAVAPARVIRARSA